MGVMQSASRFIIAIDMVFLLLLGFSALYIEPGTGSYVAAQLTLVPTLVTLGGAIAVLYTGWEPF